MCVHIYVQGVSLPQRQILGDSRHEDKYYQKGKHGAQTSSLGAKGL